MSQNNGKKKQDVKVEFTISPMLQQIEKKISEAQQIQLDVIAKTNFNNFNGGKIATWLKENHKMWRTVLFHWILFPCAIWMMVIGTQIRFLFIPKMVMGLSWKKL